jgi:hypothetical protein
MTQSSGVSPAASTDIFRPLIFRVAIVSSPPVDEAAYGGNSRVGNRSDTHRVDVGLDGRMSALSSEGNRN